MHADEERTHTRRESDELAASEQDHPDVSERAARSHDADALARFSDPSLAARRDRLSVRVRDRSGLRWVPASELLRRGSERAGGAVSRGQERLHRFARDRVTAGVKRTATIAAERVATLGRPRPIPSGHEPSAAVTRDAV